MRSVLVSFGLLSVFMLVSSLPLGPATLEKRQYFKRVVDVMSNNADCLNTDVTNRIPVIGGVNTNQASFLVQNVENLSDTPSESVDAYTIAFGIRTRIHVESIRNFSAQETTAQIICDAGFKTVGKVYEDLTFGVVAIHSDYNI
ncbi:hypothetical protein G6F61_007666 [Rhizopus arrhizus]|nr:hypothetical protein G6F61_007666 [Rhizopus arrhizus]